jgi:hypothetical protein
MTEPRDWDKKMAEIDRAIAKQTGGRTDEPPVSRGDARVAPGTATTPSPPRAARRSVALTWFWAGLAVALGVALLVWPYDKTCGIRLVFFLGAAGMTALVGLLGSLAGWANRRGLAHLVSLLVLAWAGVMAAREVLPRIGYAKQAATWGCAVEVPTEPAPAQAPAPTT